MSKRKDQKEHDEMIIALTSHLRHHGHTNVKADIDGYIQPEPVAGPAAKTRCIPDVTSTFGGEFVFEVETSDSIDEAHTELQWNVLATDSQAKDKRFIIVVPKGADKHARHRAKELGIPVNDVWTVR